MIRLFLVASLSLIIAACGNKGDLLDRLQGSQEKYIKSQTIIKSGAMEYFQNARRLVFEDSLRECADFKADTVFLLESFSSDEFITYGSIWANDQKRGINYRVSASGELEYRQQNYNKELLGLFEELKFDSIREITKSTVYEGDVYLGTVIVKGTDYIHFSFAEPSLEWQRKAAGFD